MCFSPQRRAILRHRNFKKCFGADVFCTFSLQNVLFATAAYNFSASELRKVVRGRQFFNILTLKCAFRHSGVQFCDIVTHKMLRTWRFLHIFTSECAFRHSGVQFFDMSTSKSGPRLWCFAHFDLRMCFSPQRRAIFDVTSQHLPPPPPL